MINASVFDFDVLPISAVHFVHFLQILGDPLDIACSLSCLGSAGSTSTQPQGKAVGPTHGSQWSSTSGSGTAQCEWQ